jgi:hypothetical protein
MPAIGPRGAGDAPTRVAVRSHHHFQRSMHRLQLGAQPGITPGVERAHPVFGERLAGFGLDARALVAHRLADEDLHALGLCECPATLVEHLAQHAVGDGLAVHEHTVAIKKHPIEPHHNRSPST